MLLLDLLRAVRNDLWSPQYRFNYLYELLRGMPGEAGMELRSRFAARHFGSAGTGVRVYQGARFDGVKKMKVGDRVRIGVDNHFQAAAGLTIGNDTIFGPGVKIWTINHRFDDMDRPIFEQGWEFRAVSIGANVWVGANTFIMPGVEIPDGCVISAGAVVGIRQYPPYSVIAGHPARVIGRRAGLATSGGKPDTPKPQVLEGT